MIKLPYEVKIETINKDNIGNYQLSRFKRNIRKAHVNSIFRALDAGKHFHMPIAVFKVDNSYQVGVTRDEEASEAIDGNHRLTAIAKWLDKNPTESIEVVFMIYKFGKNKNINNEIRRTFTEVNIPQKQNTDDFIAAYKDTIKIYEPLCGSDQIIPCSIYGGRNEIKFKLIVGAYLSAKNKVFKGTTISGAREFVSEVQKLTKSDIEVIHQFWNDYSKMFNLDAVQNYRGLACMKTTAVYSMFFLWYHNKERLGRKLIIEKVRDKLANTKLFDEWSRLPGQKSSIEALNHFIRKLNKGPVSKNYFTHE